MEWLSVIGCRLSVKSQESECPQLPCPPYQGSKMSGIGVPSYQGMSQQVSCQRFNNRCDLHQVYCTGLSGARKRLLRCKNCRSSEMVVVCESSCCDRTKIVDAPAKIATAAICRCRRFAGREANEVSEHACDRDKEAETADVV